jgi:hypothetical protein
VRRRTDSTPGPVHAANGSHVPRPQAPEPAADPALPKGSLPAAGADPSFHAASPAFDIRHSALRIAHCALPTPISDFGFRFLTSIVPPPELRGAGRIAGARPGHSSRAPRRGPTGPLPASHWPFARGPRRAAPRHPEATVRAKVKPSQARETKPGWAKPAKPGEGVSQTRLPPQARGYSLRLRADCAWPQSPAPGLPHRVVIPGLRRHAIALIVALDPNERRGTRHASILPQCVTRWHAARPIGISGLDEEARSRGESIFPRGVPGGTPSPTISIWLWMGDAPRALPPRGVARWHAITFIVPRDLNERRDGR